MADLQQEAVAWLTLCREDQVANNDTEAVAVTDYLMNLLATVDPLESVAGSPGDRMEEIARLITDELAYRTNPEEDGWTETHHATAMAYELGLIEQDDPTQREPNDD